MKQLPLPPVPALSDFDPAWGVDGAARDRLAALVANLFKWQRAINLVAASTLAQVWTRHVADSLQLVPLVPKDCRILVDLGSGAGFPGLVLAAVLPGAEVHLIESDARKAEFLRDSARLCGIPAVIHPCRIADAPAIAAECVTARALAPLAELLEMSARFCGPATVRLFPKGRNFATELTEAGKTWTLSADRVASRTDPEGAILRIVRAEPVAPTGRS